MKDELLEVVETDKKKKKKVLKEVVTPSYKPLITE